jgi:iron complex outermembrane receptor protein
MCWKVICRYSPSLAILLPAAAMAQTPDGSADPLPPSTTNPAPPPASAGAPTDPADAASAGIADIIVTAQKRDTTLQRTAAAVQVIGAATLVERGVTDLVRLQTQVTGVIIQPNRTGIFMFSRGLGQADAQYQTSPAIEVQADGLTLPRSAQQFALFDIGDIQVLKGPQGILYGRYGIGGAMLVNSKRPTYDRIKAEGTIEVGNYDLVHSFAAVNLPVSDNAAFRVSVDTNRHDGYVTNGANDLDQISGRVSFQADATDRLTIFLAATGSRRKGQGFVQATFPRPTEADGDPYVILPVPSSGVVNGVNFNDYHNRGFLDQKSYLINGELDYQITDDLTFSYVGGYFNNDSEQVNAFQNKTGDIFVNYASSYYVEKSWDIQNEARLSFERDGLTAIVGALHHRFEAQDNVLQTSYRAGTFINGPQSPTETNYAIFADVIVPVSDRLRLEVGARQSWDSKHTSGRLSGQLVDINSSNFEGFKYFAWKIGAEYDVTDRVLTYANVQTGYLPGAYQTATQEVLTSLGLGRRYESQEVTAYQAGVKSRFLDNRVQLNIEAFYYDYKNFQVTQRITDPFNPNSFQSPYANIEKSRIYGADVDLNAQIIDGGTLTVGLALLNTRIINSGFTKLSVIQPNGLARNELGQNGFPPLDPSLRGYDLPFSPEVMLNLAYEQVFELGNDASVIFNAGTHYESSKWLDYAQSPLPLGRHPSFWKTDLSLTYRAPGNAWSIGAWIRNLEDTATYSTFTPNQARVGGVLVGAYSYVYLDAPRTYGLRAGFTF